MLEVAYCAWIYTSLLSTSVTVPKNDGRKKGQLKFSAYKYGISRKDSVKVEVSRLIQDQYAVLEKNMTPLCEAIGTNWS